MTQIKQSNAKTDQKAPFQADHVGSFLRPERIKQARLRKANGDITANDLWEIENEEIAKLVKKQKEVGLQSVTDGELRRAWFHLDFIQELVGVKFIELDTGLTFNGEKTKAHSVKVVGKLDFDNHPVVEEYKYLHSVAGSHTAKMTIPSPSMLYFREIGEEEKEFYPSKEALFSDIAEVYKKTIKALYDAGCRYLQLDDTTWSLFLEQESRSDLVLSGGILKARGDDPKEISELFAKTINEAIVDKPEDMTITMHICRGNYKSTYAGSGSYDAVSKIIFGDLNVDGLFLEFDDERSGGFEPLHHVNRPDLKIVLGLITSKFGELEDPEQIKSRIEEAAKYVPLEQLCLSPQCGFASTEEGNILTEDEQWAKIRHVVEIAESVWK
ncbi:5-methyltetrahydropteroyltriglutamate--homocysteine S-methyltransferase [Virgibacillus byunsanensis]|uniref:5-methyltetrahydropteroyltriglutamate--homocysteine S-methyltransferase n=1 Tax=Virgibacillus byunsanensis TaxID=570945 RepID=A0ABW3LNC1_9BACI